MKHRSSLVTMSLACALLLAACSRDKAPAPAESAPASKDMPATAPADDKAMESERAAPSPAQAAGAAMPGSAKRDEGAELDDIDALSGQLDHAIRLSTPDCTLAPSLRDRICDLSQRICDIAARSNESEITDRCHDARNRCSKATTSVRSACPE